MPKWAKEPLRNKIADQLRGQILSGEYQPGDRIREEQLAADFGVSRVPVREALQLLEQERYLVIRPRRGAIVDSPAPSSGHELMAIRSELEGMAARLAAERRGGEFAPALLATVESGEDALRRDALDELPPLIVEFHELVAEASGNRELVALLQAIRNRIEWILEINQQQSTGSWSEHREIYNLIIAGDTAGVDELMKQHVGTFEHEYDLVVPNHGA